LRFAQAKDRLNAKRENSPGPLFLTRFLLAARLKQMNLLKS
jgi:hypothetical protein